MACVYNIFIHGSNKKTETMAVTVHLKPAGEVRVDVPIPQPFFDCLMAMAQLGADLHEQQMKAEILADNLLKEPNKDEHSSNNKVDTPDK